MQGSPDLATTSATATTTLKVNLRILATTDMHAHLLAHDYFADRPTKSNGLTRVATLIKRARDTVENCLLLDNGDFLQGTPLADYFGNPDPDTPRPHPVISAMNYLKYDAVALGNHEFNDGLTTLQNTLQSANFPRLCANLKAIGPDDQARLQDICLPHTILEKPIRTSADTVTTLKIGLFGVLPPQITDWDNAHLGGRLVARDMFSAAQKATQQLKDQGADLIIGLAHTGLTQAPPTSKDPAFQHPAPENDALALAGIKNVDVVICGHTHQVFPNAKCSTNCGANYGANYGANHTAHPDIDAQAGTLAGKPAVMAGFAGSHLGQIDLVLTADSSNPDTVWQVTSSTSQTLAVHPSGPTPSANVAPTAEDPDLVKLLLPFHEEALREIRRPVGMISHPVNSFFALLGDEPSVRVIGDVQANYVRTQLCDTSYGDLPILSATAPFKCGGRSGPSHYTDVPAGPFAIRHVADWQYFPNTICALHLTGAEIADWLEMSASAYQTVTLGLADQPLRDSNVPSYNCDTIVGLDYEIDLSQPARFSGTGQRINTTAQRIKHLTWQGTPVTSDQPFILATNNYRVGGGGHFPGITADKIILQTQKTIRDALTAYLLENKAATVPTDPRWRFGAMPDTSVYFDTNPHAQNLLDTMAPLDLEVIGPRADGFLRLRLNL